MIQKIIILGLISFFQFSTFTQIGFASPTAGELNIGRNAGLAYLLENQNGDGSWGESEYEKIRVTATVLQVCNKYGITGLVYQRGLNWLSNSEPFTADDLARKFQVLNDNNIPVDIDMLLELGHSESYSSISGTSWGAQENLRYSTFDTTAALNTLIDILPTDATTIDSINYLKSYRNTAVPTDETTGSGWANSASKYNAKGQSGVLPTAQVLLLFHKIGGAYWGQYADKYAAHWLALQQYANGAISDSDDQAIIETAFAAQALGVAKDVSGADPSVSTAYGKSLDFLLSKQEQNGSVDHNLYATAVVVNALFSEEVILPDSDTDGIPDDIESVIGTNPNLIDTDYLETGNGLTPQNSYGGQHIYEFVINRQGAIRLDSSNGNISINSESIPPGFTIRSLDNTLIGTPTQLGSFSIFYQVTDSSGSVSHGTALIRVVTSDSDTDGDLMPAGFEASYSSFLSSLNGNDANFDYDDDGLTNYMEYVFGMNPSKSDSDGDGISDQDELSGVNSDGDNMPDLFEVQYGLNPYVDDADQDFDNDGLTNYEEYVLGLLPNNPDTDNDGLLDGEDPNPRFNPGAIIPILHLLITGEANEQQAASLNEMSESVPWQEFEDF